MIISHSATNSFKINVTELTNLIINDIKFCSIEDGKCSAFLHLTEDAPEFSIRWGNKMLVKEANKPFSIEHPLLNKHTFKITNVRPKPKPISIFEWLKTR